MNPIKKYYRKQFYIEMRKSGGTYSIVDGKLIVDKMGRYLNLAAIDPAKELK